MPKYIHFTEEEKNRANSVDLEDFLVKQGEKLIRSGKEKRLTCNRSITVRGNRWYDHGTEKGGFPVDLLREFYNISYPEAVQMLLGMDRDTTYQTTSKDPVQNEKLPFILPEKNENMRRVFAYLLKERFIDKDVLSCFAREGLVYEDKTHHNIVFVGMDEKGIPRHAHRKGTSSFGPSFRGNVEGSDPEYSFNYITKRILPYRLFVFESPIDMLSYISLHKNNWQNASYVALNGLSEKAILKQLELHPKIEHIVLCLDNDSAGIKATERMYHSLSDKGPYSIGRAMPQNKDWNDDLKARCGFLPSIKTNISMASEKSAYLTENEGPCSPTPQNENMDDVNQADHTYGLFLS